MSEVRMRDVIPVIENNLWFELNQCNTLRLQNCRITDETYTTKKVIRFISRPYFIWERKIFKSNAFCYKICQAPNLILTSRVLPIEFSSRKFSFVRYVFKDFWIFWE